VLDTTLLADGSYWVELYATDTNGNTQNNLAMVKVVGDYKPGRVTTTVTDLLVPAPAMPIQIQRTYDSLVRGASSDFGYGWTLGVNVQLEVSPSNDVTLTLNGQRRTFYFTPYVPGYEFSSGWFVPNLLTVYFPAYTAEPGMYGTLSVWNGGSGLIGSNSGCVLDWCGFRRRKSLIPNSARSKAAPRRPRLGANPQEPAASFSFSFLP
jgi:hypothetical protein